MRSRIIVSGLIVITALAIIAYLTFPRLIEARRISQVKWPTTGWSASTPEAGGLDSAILATGLQTIAEKDVQIDSLLIIRHGEGLLDADFYPYNSAYLHDLASVTKSFTTTLIGIAADQGKLKLDDPVLSFFPERTVANRDERKERMTVRHLAMMKNGFASGCLAGDMPTIMAMMAEPDWVQAALDRPMAADPGTEFCYDSPGMHLLSAILQKATGMTAHEFAHQNLFESLGIDESYWLSDPQGITRGWGDLHLKPEDAAKLGFLWLNKGMWDGKRIISAKWVKDSVKFSSDLGNGDGYGYGWWLWDTGYGASGRGGQSIKVVPGMDLILVTTGGGFDYDSEVNQYLESSVIDLEKPLPANPQGVSQLTEVINALAQPDDPQPVEALTETAMQVSGKTYVFEPNWANIESLAIEFDDTSEAKVSIKYVGSEAVTSPVGLDGIYRPTTEGDLKRGYWADPQTFIIEIYDVGQYTLRISFEDGRVSIDVPEFDLLLKGQEQNP